MTNKKAKEFTYTQTIKVYPFLLDGKRSADNYGVYYTVESKTSNIKDNNIIRIDKDGKAHCAVLPKNILVEIGKEFTADAIAVMQNWNIERANKKKLEKINKFDEIEQEFKTMLRDPDITEYIVRKGA